MNKIGVIGAGAFGTALATTLASAGNAVTLWGRNAEQMKTLHTTKRNQKYLPDIPLAETLSGTTEFSDLAGSSCVLIVTPAQIIRHSFSNFDIAGLGCPLVLCSKGIEQETGLLQTDIASEFVPESQLAVLSGPSFAVDLAMGKPTALTLGASDIVLGEKLQELLSTNTMRLYLSDDPRGVQLGGALKNVFAIACGFLIGAGLGESARAALMTRAFAELSRLTTTMGGRADTLIGLSGFGDLTLSCSSELSRNFSFGLQLARSGNLTSTTTVEGIATALATTSLAKKYDIDMPIAHRVAAVLQGASTFEEALQTLMARPLKREGQ